MITNKYDIKEIIAPLKGKEPRLWQALDTLNSGVIQANQDIDVAKSLSLYQRITLELPLTGTTDLARYVVQMPIDALNSVITKQLNITRMLITSKVASAGDKIDVLLSNDRGTTFNSILKPSGGPVVYDKGELPAGVTLISYGVSQFTRAVLNDNDFLRIDFLSGTIGDGLTVDLIGNYGL